MKTIKINFVGFWSDFDKENNFISQILSKRYNVEVSEKPDYVIASVLGVPYEYCKYPNAVRILFSGENYSPDFNAFDYAISFDRCSYGDRYLRYPLYLLYSGDLELAQKKHLEIDMNLLKNKNHFCNFIYGHDTDEMQRKKFFEILSQYKAVDSYGTYLNNTGITVLPNEKMNYMSNSKFTIAFESCCLEGFITEKILQAYAAKTIPIYLGDPTVDLDFNSKSFINCARYKDFESVKQKIIELDQNDNLYLEMLKQPIFENNYIEKKNKELEDFLVNIFEQDKKVAFRRPIGPRDGIVESHEKHMKIINKMYYSRAYKIYKMLMGK